MTGTRKMRIFILQRNERTGKVAPVLVCKYCNTEIVPTQRKSPTTEFPSIWRNLIRRNSRCHPRKRKRREPLIQRSLMCPAANVTKKRMWTALFTTSCFSWLAADTAWCKRIGRWTTSCDIEGKQRAWRQGKYF